MTGQHACRGLPSAGQAGIIQAASCAPMSACSASSAVGCTLSGASGTGWLEDLADHRRQFLSPLSVVRVQLLRGELDGRRGGIPQCTILIGAED